MDVMEGWVRSLTGSERGYEAMLLRTFTTLARYIDDQYLLASEESRQCEVV